MGRGAEAIAAAVVRSGSRLEGTVRLSASQVAANYLLPGLVARLRVLEPGIQIELVATNALSNLLRREADIAVRMVPPRQASLLARRVATVQIGAYAAAEYLRRRGVPRIPADLLAHDLVGFDTDDSLLRGFARQGVAVERGQFAVRTDDHVVAWQAVCAGAGIGFGACYVGAQEPRVQRVLPELPIAPLPMWLAVHREIRGSARIRRVFDFLAASLPQQVAARRAPPHPGT
jgi:DNA-binding transcriptional LysR family regulator